MYISHTFPKHTSMSLIIFANVGHHHSSHSSSSCMRFKIIIMPITNIAHDHHFHRLPRRSPLTTAQHHHHHRCHQPLTASSPLVSQVVLSADCCIMPSSMGLACDDGTCQLSGRPPRPPNLPTPLR
jgi:hypothetical protein